jgi:hypothetical protein
MELILLTVPDCPHAAVFEERLAVALAGRSDAVVRRREIAGEREAAQAGMHGSPTLLINGVDPFAVPGQVPGLACRLYRDATGRAAGAPPVEDLRRAVEQAGTLLAASSRSGECRPRVTVRLVG